MPLAGRGMIEPGMVYEDTRLHHYTRAAIRAGRCGGTWRDLSGNKQTSSSLQAFSRMQAEVKKGGGEEGARHTHLAKRGVGADSQQDLR